MKEKSAWIMTLLILTSGMCCAPEPAQEATGKAPPAAEGSEVGQVIGTTWIQHIEAAERGDLAGVLAMHTDDIVYVTAGQSGTHGIKELEEVERKNLANVDVVSAKHTTESLQVFGGTAFEVATIDGIVQPKGGEPQTLVFRFMAKWRRVEGAGWKVAYLVGDTQE